MWRDWLAAISLGRTYNPVRNGWAFFGLLWGIPVPVFSVLLHWKLAGSMAAVWQGWTLHLFFAAHPPLFMVLFGAIGTMHWLKEQELLTATRRLERIAITDALTGLFNRRYLVERLSEEVERSRRTSNPLACLMVDLDGFKPVNDRFGHAAGDLVLQEVARRLESLKRDYDLLGRLGGDEFVYALPQTQAADARQFGSRILSAISGRGFEVRAAEQPQRLTASIGVALFPGDGETAKDLLAAADRAMYQAKGKGRNRCVMTSELASSEAASPP